MDFSYAKNEKLKGRKIIDLLFKEGKSVSKYPLRLVYTPLTDGDKKLTFGVSVSKKHFKRAVDRNHFKRLLRECYRLNKYLIIENIEQPIAIMFFYQTKEKLSYKEIHEKTILLFNKFVIELACEKNDVVK